MYDSKNITALLIFCTLFPLLLITAINLDIFEVIAKKQYVKKLSKQKININIKKTLLSNLSINFVRKYIYFKQNRIVNLCIYSIFVFFYWIFIITNYFCINISKNEPFNWINYIALFVQVLLLAWFISRLCSKKLKHFFMFMFMKNKFIKIQKVNTSKAYENLLKLKSINFNPITKNDRKQIIKINKTIQEIKDLINSNNQLALMSSCLLLYYYLLIYQNNKNKQVNEFVNSSFKKNIIVNKKVINVIDDWFDDGIYLN